MPWCFDFGVFVLVVLSYITTQIAPKGFVIIELCTYFPYCPLCSIMGFYSFCLQLMSVKVVVRTWIVIL